jgi:hypothetical protein
LKKKTMLRKTSKNGEEWKEVPISCSIWWGSLFGVQSKSTHLFEMEHRRDKCLLQSVQFCFTAFSSSGILGDMKCWW